MPPAARARASMRQSSGRVAFLLPLLLLILGLVVAGATFRRQARAEGVGIVDLTALRFLGEGCPVTGSAEADLRRELDRVLSAHTPLDLSDERALSALGRDLAASPWIAEVRALRPRWPSELEVDLIFHEAVACVFAGGLFRMVAREGRILPGGSPEPPLDGPAALPVLRPTPLIWSGEAPAPGSWLYRGRVPGTKTGGLEQEGQGSLTFEDVSGVDLLGSAQVGFCRDLLRALAVARSFHDELSAEERARFGRVVIDAAPELAWDGLVGGVVLLLDDARVMHLGASPMDLDPAEAGSAEEREQALVRRAGELAASAKWAHALSALADPAGDWTDADLRFDDLRLIRTAPPEEEQ